MDLDRIDRAILEALQNNARLSNKELATRVGLAPSSCLERVRRLETAGVLKGFHAEVDPQSLGVSLEAMISIQLRQQSRERIEAFERDLAALPEVVALYHVSGAHDFLLHVAVRDTAHLRELGLDQICAPHDVSHLETALVFRHVKSHAYPDFLTT